MCCLAVTTMLYNKSNICTYNPQGDMKINQICFLSFLLFSSLLPLSPSLADDGIARRTYIVHLKSPTTVLTAAHKKAWHRSFLPASATTATTSGSGSEDDPRIFYSYHRVFSGFAARLTEAELEAVASKEGFLQAYPDQKFAVQTTYSPAFLGLNRNVGNFWNTSSFGTGVIVGVLDTGIIASHPSFGDQGMPPPPQKWKGGCEFDASDCNNKLIGVRVFTKGSPGNGTGDPVDRNGHGTHTASTVAGRPIDNASVLGNALGTASGVAPMAHVAMYKVCPDESCSGVDILAGMEAAIADGVDVLSISLALDFPSPFFNDHISIGALAAVEKGIFVSCAAGNTGPKEGSVLNAAPWIMTVGASTTDRSVLATVKLGNGDKFDGKSLSRSEDSGLGAMPLIHPGSLDASYRFCTKNSFDKIDIRGKIVVCDIGGGITGMGKGINVKNAGGVAMILANGADAGFSVAAAAHFLPTVHVTFADATKIKGYINQTSSNATAAIISKGTMFGEGPAAPMVAHFSSRGPSSISKGIPKPDILAPGVDVLAAWPPLLPIGLPPVRPSFNMISGTSMSTPHLSGVVALLKSAHPDWSPAMIRSAIMTTADTTNAASEPIADQNLNQASVFAKGAGHVNPTKANNPGLVYDIDPDDYVGYMCGLSFPDLTVSFIARLAVNCSSIARKIFGAELNYPSFFVTLGPANNFTRRVTRVVTNVGDPKAVYTVDITQPVGASVTVTPEVLDSTKAGDKYVATYSVEFARSSDDAKGLKFSEGAITWLSSDEVVRVRSPIVIAFD